VIRIAIDMDEVIADFVPKFLREYNRLYPDPLTLEELKGNKIRELRPHRTKEITSLIQEPTFFRDLAPVSGSQRVVRELTQRFEVFITTAAMEFPTSFTAKYEWLKEHFGFVSEMNYVFCGDKSIIRADYLIDDHDRHFQGFMGRGILFTAAHNLLVEGYDRVNDWDEVAEYFKSLQ
jgi:5'(3')-deoxyribonucleotidase